ncbi:MAG: glycoside hydrolase family 15 protein, partial [Dermatophilaceae bacterium]
MSRPIEDYALLSDCHSSALVSTDGSVEWLMFPRFDSPSVLGRILDERAGHFRVSPRDVAEVGRRYLPGTLVLVTTFTTADGTLELTDALALGEGRRDHALGEGVPHTLLRHAVCVAGRVQLQVEFAPRPEYGFTQPLLRRTADGVAVAGGPDGLSLSTDVPLTIDGGTARGTVELASGADARFALQWSRPWERSTSRWSSTLVEHRLADTVAGWQSWSALHQAYDGPWQDLVRFSGVVLQGLTFQPTGAIVAAPTTSLPETPGGSRNWDYRYSWLRDASMTLDALWVAACPDEARSFVSWLVEAAASDVGAGARIQVMYGIAGEHDLAERPLEHLSGWRDSRPVRIGNGAFDQRQLDVYGEVLDAVLRLRDQLTPFDEPTRVLLRGIADAAADEWGDPDQGIWEVRSGPQHFLHSKLMCWVALDRALDLADDLQCPEEQVARWARERDAIREAILTRGFVSGAFTQAFGSTALDASALRIPIVGFLPGDDPRVRSTIAAIEDRLTDRDGMVHRYLADDGLEGEEGTFLLCTFWLA